MPREKQKRGRREQQKRKRNDEDHEMSPKRQRTSEDRSMTDQELDVHGDAGDDYIGFEFSKDEPAADVPQNQFYGLLEPEEQEYYVSVNNKISANDFETDEDRSLFIQAVHRETEGKEMKVASSQSCSRYLEKVILLSSGEQLESLFSAFLENLTYLVQHRFGSHCCETLFFQAAKYVHGGHSGADNNENLESMFLRTLEALEPNIGFLLTERFASHTIRVLLIILSGEAFDDETTKSMIASKRKEKLDVTEVLEASTKKRKVPDSFRKALHRFVDIMLASIDTTYLRALATHPIGNPVLQLLLKLELATFAKSKSHGENVLLKKLLPNEDFTAESENERFLIGLTYDPTGSHLVEILVQHLPGKLFRDFYRNILKERMRNLSKNDVASYVAIKILERLGKDELREATNEISNEIAGLITRSRTNIVKVLFERCSVRDVDTKRLAEAVKNAYDADQITLLPKMLKFHASIEDLAHHAVSNSSEGTANISPYKADIHGSLLAQAMLDTPTACVMIQDSINSQPGTTLVTMANNPTASRVLQVALTSEQSSPSFRRQLVPKFYGSMLELAVNSAGSHVADALWQGTSGVHHMKEKLAKEMQQHEEAIRNSIYGRTVWRNWSMDSYARHFREWQALAKGHDQKQAEHDKGDSQKTAIELARERHLQKRMKSTTIDSKRAD